MRLNYGCGRRVLDGYFNIDAQLSPKAPRPPELLHALEFNADGTIQHKTPLEDECADELFAAHLIEHFFEWEAPYVIQEWARLLKPGGKLILELPDIIKAAKNLIAGMPPQMCIFPLYGDGSHKDPYMTHKFGYSPATIKALVQANGFTQVKILPPLTHGPKPNRDMRVEAVKA
jgi:SAM-dependent methyltransferase